tara:strand:- start:23 stop:700 length:678 start_codon:yes stop_codon:yes gene_type:complete
MTSVGYNGYVANNPQPNLLECNNNMKTDSKDNFNLFKKGSIRSDQLEIDLDVMQSQGPGYYILDNQFGCECGLKEAISIQTSQPGINLNGGSGWIGEKGCLVQNDTKLRMNPDRLTNPRTINQITERLTATTPGLTKGYYDVDVESIIRPGDFTSDQIPCMGNSEVTYGNQYTPMIPKLKNEVQDPIHIIPENSRQDWVRGGLPTRQMVRNEDYLRRCQEKTFKK